MNGATPRKPGLLGCLFCYCPGLQGDGENDLMSQRDSLRRSTLGSKEEALVRGRTLLLQLIGILSQDPVHCSLSRHLGGRGRRSAFPRLGPREAVSPETQSSRVAELRTGVSTVAQRDRWRLWSAGRQI